MCGVGAHRCVGGGARLGGGTAGGVVLVAWGYVCGGMGDMVTHLQREGAAQRGLEGGTWVLVPVLVAESMMMGQ